MLSDALGGPLSPGLGTFLQGSESYAQCLAKFSRRLLDQADVVCGYAGELAGYQRRLFGYF